MTFDLTQLREGWDFEAKLAAGRDGRGALPASFWETYAAMANTDGGTVVLGVAERADGSLEVAGLTRAAKVEQDLWNLLDNRKKVSANLLTRADVQQHAVGSGDVLVITIPRAPRTVRPVYLNGNPLNAFRRSREGDRRCSEAEVRRMMADAGDEPVDGEILEGFGLDDLDRETLETWRNLFRSHQPDHPFLGGDDQALLTSLGGWRRERATGRQGLTVAGLLMFGQERPILDRFPRYQLDYREAGEGMPGERWQDRVTVDGTWPGNVFAFFRRVFPRLSADLKVPFRLDAELRRVDVTPAHEALREALVNALIHADYTGTRGIRVFKRRTSFELVNPGTLRVPWADACAGNASDPRNPSLQKMFQLIGFGDRAGSGVPRILQAWREQHWRPPEVAEDFEANETRLVLSTESLLPTAVVEMLEARFGDRFRALSEPQRAALATAAAEKRTSNRRLQQVSDLHPRDLTLLLRDLVRDGFLVPHGERTGRWYELPRPEQSSRRRSEQSSEQRSERSSEQRAEDGGAAAVKATRWSPREQVEEAILSLCRDRFVGLPELASSLGRAPATVRTHYLKILLREGRLLLRFPDTPNHPKQSYRAAPSERG